MRKLEEMELTKGKKKGAIIVKKKLVRSANRLHYTFIRAGPVFLVRLPILSVLGLPFQTVRARVKFGSARIKFGTEKVIYTVKFIRAERIFWYAYYFYLSRAKHFR